jgi:hypothetical protein
MMEHFGGRHSVLLSLTALQRDGDQGGDVDSAAIGSPKISTTRLPSLMNHGAFPVQKQSRIDSHLSIYKSMPIYTYIQADSCKPA